MVRFVVARDRDECEYFGGAPILHNPGRANLHPNLLAGMVLSIDLDYRTRRSTLEHTYRLPWPVAVF